MIKQTKNEMKKISLYLVSAIILIIASIILGTVSMIASFSLPIENITENVKKSSELLYEEGEDYSLTSLCKSKLDNFTDAIMLANAAYNGDETVIDKSMNVYMNNIDNGGRVDALYHYYHDLDEYSFFREEYGRYWHGYLVILKPLLMIMDYRAIRTVNVIVQTLLNIVIVLLLYKNKHSIYIIPYLLSVCFIMPLATAFSMQYATIFYIFSISMIVMLLFENKVKNKLYVFMFFTAIGISTAFFDFLTYPIATFGMVAALYYCVTKIDSLKEKIYDGAISFFCWAFGYGGMWIGKWVVYTLLTTGKNLISESIQSVKYRTSNVSGRGNFSMVGMIGKNVLAFIKTPVTIFAVIFIVVMVFMLLRKTQKSSIDFKASIPFIIIALMPIAWYIFASNHSFLHYQFTYKSLIVSAFSGMCMFANLYLSKKIPNGKNSLE